MLSRTQFKSWSPAPQAGLAERGQALANAMGPREYSHTTKAPALIPDGHVITSFGAGTARGQGTVINSRPGSDPEGTTYDTQHYNGYD